MDWNEYIDKIKARLERERDELRERARRAKAGAGDELDKMEEKWKAFVSRVADVELSDVTDEVRETAEKLATELRDGYSRLREAFGEAGGKRDAADPPRGGGSGGSGKGQDGWRSGDDAEGGKSQDGARGGGNGEGGEGHDGDGGTGGTYTMGYGDEFRRVLERRSAQSHAADLLPLLRRGMRVLDFGCGTGSISVGLAEAVAPGELRGIDMEESQIAIATAAAKAGGHDNAFFQQGDAAALPFEDDEFDAAHCNAVLMHVPGTQAVLAEVKRVLKPGGLLSVRELNTPSSFIEPDFGQLAAAWTTFSGLLSANGGHPGMGREIAGLLREDGWENVRANGSFELFRTADDRAFFHRFVSEWFFSEETVEAVTKHGLVPPEQLDAWRDALDRWRDHPGGLAGFAWGGAVASKPG